ncbi:MAG: biopolymer transporter ExbD [Tenuifilaceae bacterium]|jgi:biopolymer transport protein ExbD|uniref:ExbD/TolR family protein n=1 Tax=Perlabentimonas gracilis TaxID=2715279 RepID=UPI00140DFE5D|nr:biopolymer transporter ExbD [Perlabentimonas gracilis]MDX9770837.1 biopolymer transporter ExbD [Tenuifilaceae bacterium]NHB70037.1 biopolymer transporter ExbD [Perlabentimonas gracilis]
MAVIKKKGEGGTPAINTASLPDIVFMLLFFFMVSTTMRETEMMVRVKLPEATEVVKLEKKSLVSYIFIGPPARQYQGLFGTDSRIQLNDSFKTLVDIRDFISAERDALSEADRAFLTTSLKVDEETRMGIVTDVKQELRKASALKISYSARRTE